MVFKVYFTVQKDGVNRTKERVEKAVSIKAAVEKLKKEWGEIVVWKWEVKK